MVLSLQRKIWNRICVMSLTSEIKQLCVIASHPLLMKFQNLKFDSCISISSDESNLGEVSRIFFLCLT